MRVRFPLPAPFFSSTPFPNTQWMALFEVRGTWVFPLHHDAKADPVTAAPQIAILAVSLN
ncbi:MAG: hypothetical protein ACN4GG_10170 [Akkermansiaceae bacterium]